MSQPQRQELGLLEAVQRASANHGIVSEVVFVPPAIYNSLQNHANVQSNARSDVDSFVDKSCNMFG